jgi:hypothetical protein
MTADVYYAVSYFEQIQLPMLCNKL